MLQLDTPLQVEKMYLNNSKRFQLQEAKEIIDSNRLIPHRMQKLRPERRQKRPERMQKLRPERPERMKKLKP